MFILYEYLCWVDLDLGSSPGWWATTIATYCPSKMMELPKSKSTKPRYPGRQRPGADCLGNLEPNLKWFFKLKLKPKTFPLNCHPAGERHPHRQLVRRRHRGRRAHEAARGAEEDGGRQGESAGLHQEDLGQRGEVFQSGGSGVVYRVTHLLANLGWVELDLGCSTTLLGQ